MNNTSVVKDWHSFSNFKEIRATHLDLTIEVDFKVHQINGMATWSIDPKPGVEHAIFDTKQMQIHKVYNQNQQALSFELGSYDEDLGRALKVKIEKKTTRVQIQYTTSKDAMALQWMEASQTAGKRHPYLFTQGQFINTRTWVPGPDGPGYRFTFEAEVKVPEGLMALMSADNPQEIKNDGVYYFNMPQKIPAYLMSLAVGDVRFKGVDERTGVYAEPELLEKAHAELEDLGEMVTTAENLYGEYQWGRYDVLILPPGFPFGGMENPRLTFATPTILAGDKSLVNLIAHELAHSWSGNLVTNATWNDFWLNEGFTVYFERRISEALYGEDYAAMLWDLGLQSLQHLIKQLPARRTWLFEDLKGMDPEEGFSKIPYEKGAAFLLKMEQVFGRKRWDEFVVKYFNDFAFGTIDTDRFLVYLRDNLLKESKEKAAGINPKAWIFEPGVPANLPRVKNPRFKKLEAELEKYNAGTPASQLEAKEWSTHEYLYFLRHLPERLDEVKMKELDEYFHFTETKNSEIAVEWFLLALRSGYEAIYDNLSAFLMVTGRMKFIEPLYSELLKTTNGKARAKKLYKEARQNYHPMGQRIVDKLLLEN